MLEDVHLRICKYYPDGAEVFPNTDIKGGVVITYHDEEKTFDPIRRMYKDERHRPLVEKAINAKGFRPLSGIIGSQGTFKYADAFLSTILPLARCFAKAPRTRYCQLILVTAILPLRSLIGNLLAA